LGFSARNQTLNISVQVIHTNTHKKGNNWQRGAQTGPCNLQAIILEDHLPTKEALAIEGDLLLRENISIKTVTEEHYLKALTSAEDQHVGTNDALAYVLMDELGLKSIYSFDKDFDRFKDIDRITA